MTRDRRKIVRYVIDLILKFKINILNTEIFSILRGVEKIKS